MKAAHSSGSRAKNGKVYTNVVIWINDDEDKFGNIGSISLSEPKDSQEKKTYIGNFKEPKSQAAAPLEKGEVAGDKESDDLPF